MNGEKFIKVLMERTAWNCARERFRASRNEVFVVCEQSSARVIIRGKSFTGLFAPTARMSSVVFYDGADTAAEAAVSLEKLRPGLDLVATPAYEYAKAREYACRNELSKVGGAA